MKIKEKLAVMTGTALFLSFGVFLSISAAAEVASDALPAPVSVPTMNEWGMIIFSLLMAGFAVWFIRKKEYRSC